MILDYKLNNKFHMVWIYSGSLSTAMDGVTWLKTVKELRDFDWYVTLLAVGPTGYNQIRGVEVLCISRPEVYLLRQAVFHLKVLQVLIQHWITIDLILFHEISAPWILPLRVLRYLTGKKLPLLVMDTRSLPMPSADNETWMDKVRRGAYLIEGKLGNQFADGRLAITQRMVKAVNIPTEKLWGTWPSGVEKEQFTQACMDRSWPSHNDSIRLIHHGSLHHERNLLTLCHAVVQANTDGMSFELSLIGAGTARAELEEYAARTQGAIHIVPPIPYEKVPESLARAHVGVLPFPDEEKFRVSSPIKLFEYMAAGLPILATRIVSHTDVVGDGKYAFWAEKADISGILGALRLIWMNRGALSEMGAQAAIAAEAWTWSESARKLSMALENGIGFYEDCYQMK